MLSFYCGLLVGTCLGFMLAGLMAMAHDPREDKTEDEAWTEKHRKEIAKRVMEIKP